jgi:hypothetical protein
VYSSDVIRMMKCRRFLWVVNAAYKGIRRITTKFWLENPDGKKQFGIPKYTLKDSIKMHF